MELRSLLAIRSVWVSNRFFSSVALSPVTAGVGGVWAVELEEVLAGRWGPGLGTIDPGFGFGKTLEQNYQLLQQMDKLQVFGLPVLVGISRKSMIYKLLGGNPATSLNGTSVLNAISLMKGAGILRVHDVKEAVEAVDLYHKMVTAGV